ncbi:MAG: stage V sporulation protein S [Caldilineaceae bacterium]
MILIRVAAESPVASVAGAIAQSVRAHRRSEVQSIGAAANNQAIKAVALARRYMAEEQIDLAMIPSLIDVQINGLTRTAVRMSVFPIDDLSKHRPNNGNGRRA